MKNQLLKDIFYGDEIGDKNRSLRWIRAMYADQLSNEAIDRIYNGTHKYFSTYHQGAFGGQVTAGDGLLIAAYMELTRPSKMIEIGVASGYSSAFILNYARDAGLLKEGKKFLFSFDLVAETASGNKTGSLLHQYYPDLASSWQLHTEVTSVGIISNPAKYIDVTSDDKFLAFVDGGHNHPWPLMDLAALRTVLPKDTWVVMQDYQMMERWIADCVQFGVPSPSPIRGVNLAGARWPGTSVIGFDLCYNSVAVKLDVDDQAFEAYTNDLLRYPFEIAFPDLKSIRASKQRL